MTTTIEESTVHAQTEAQEAAPPTENDAAVASTSPLPPPEPPAKRRQPKVAQPSVQQESAAVDELAALKEKVQALEDALAASRREAAVVKAAQQHGLPVELAMRLVATDEDPSAALDALLRQYPFLRPKPDAPTLPVANPPRPGVITLETIRKMSPEEINENWETVKRILEKGA